MSSPSHDIRAWRLILGFLVGAATPVAICAALSGPAWPLVLYFGSMAAAASIVLICVPLYVVLRDTRALNVYVAIAVGGALSIVPDLLMTISGMGANIQRLVVGKATLISEYKLTAAGWLHFFFWRPLMFFPMGAAGGLVAWLIAVGPRVRPRADLSGPFDAAGE